MTDAELDALVKRLLGTPLYEGHGEAFDVMDEAADAITALRTELAAERAAKADMLPTWYFVQAIGMVEAFSAMGVHICCGVSDDPEICLGPAILPDGTYLGGSMSLHDDGWSCWFDFKDFGGKPFSSDAFWEIPQELKDAISAAIEAKP